MRDDDVMDQLLKAAFAADAPQLSPAFDARVMRRVRPRRLTPMGRMVLAVYTLAASATAVWFLQDVPMGTIAAAFAIGVPVAAGASFYGRRIAFGQ